MKESAEKVSELLLYLESKVKVGTNLLELELLAEKYLKEIGAESYNKGYQPSWSKVPFPNILCLSVNDVIAHGIPYNYSLQDGDILKIDVGIKYKGFAGDAATTIGVGNISSRDERLMRYAKRALYIGIGEVKAGVEITEIGKKIELYLSTMGYTVNKMLCGHGIGTKMHDTPRTIPMADYTSYLTGKPIPKLEAGQVICIEPHVTYKDQKGLLDSDGFTLRNRDGKNTAEYEHMVLVKDDGFEILTSHIKI